VNSALPCPEHDARVAAHEARADAEREAARVKAEAEAAMPAAEVHDDRFPGGLRRGDLRVCNCAACGKLLLSRAWHETMVVMLREWAVSTRASVRARAVRLLDTLPPFVAGRVADRPYCREHVEEARVG
jgi:hypothetical protein